MIEIKNRTGAVIFRDENASTIKEAVNAFAKQARDRGGCAYLGGADLGGAYLGRANLGGAYLGRANLDGAYLGDANLGGANLGGANLGDANLGGANLGDADLGDADLGGAYLGGAYLGGAYLGRANLGGAYLGDADLGDADLGDAYLGGAYLGGAYLGDAYLGRANLGRANLGGAYLGGADLGGADLGGCDLSTAKNVDAVRGLAHAKNYDPNFRAPLRDEKALAERRAKWKPLTRAERIAKYRERHPEVPIVEDLDAKILEALETGGTLEMGTWHGDEVCGTTHCRGGFAVHLAPGGYEFERTVCGGDTERAARMIYRASTGRAPFFYDTNEGALADIKRCAAEDASEVVVP